MNQMATDTQSLLQWLLDLLKDDNARADFLKNPDQYLNDHGHGNVSSGDIYDALCLSSDNHSSHSNHSNHDDNNDHHAEPHHNHKGEDAGHYLKEYITNNYTNIEDRSSHIDNSLHQRIDTEGGDFHQTNDNDTVIASGDGASAVGGDNSGHIASAGHDGTNAFGDGDATKASFDHANFGSGSGVAVGGSSASGHAEDNDSVTAVKGGHGDTNVTTADDGSAAHQDVDHTANHEASFTHTDDHTDNSHTDIASHNPVHVEDVQIDHV
jgi:hypothetical protein